jgi:hypothetical protein
MKHNDGYKDGIGNAISKMVTIDCLIILK